MRPPGGTKVRNAASVTKWPQPGNGSATCSPGTPCAMVNRRSRTPGIIVAKIKIPGRDIDRKRVPHFGTGRRSAGYQQQHGPLVSHAIGQKSTHRPLLLAKTGWMEIILRQYSSEGTPR